MTRLLQDIAGFRTYDIRPRSPSLSSTARHRYSRPLLRLPRNVSTIQSEFPCWASQCGRPRLRAGAQRRESAPEQGTVGPRQLVMSFSYADLDHKESDYGHLWRSLEVFFQCVVQERLLLLRAHREVSELTLLLPTSGSSPERQFSLFHEVQTLFSGPAARLHISRQKWIPVCVGEAPSCCLNQSQLPSAGAAPG